MECKKIGLVGSSGGHLTHLYMLKPFWQKKDRFWVTFDKEDARSLLEGERVYPCYYPTNRNLKNLLKNTVVAWKVLRKEKPDLLISSGAAVAVPFFYLAKLMGKKLISTPHRASAMAISKGEPLTPIPTPTRKPFKRLRH